MTLGLTDVTVGGMDVTTVIVAVAVTAVSATEVAVTVTELGEGAAAGAVYKPVFASMVPSEPAVVTVGSDQVTFWQVGLEARTHPGLLTVATNWLNVSPVPTVAVLGVMEMLMPLMMVNVAVAVLEVSAAAVAVMVAVGVTVVVVPEVTVGITDGAVYRPLESMVPQAGAVTPVGQVTVQVTVVLLFPVTWLENCWVRFVITLAVKGEIASATPVEEFPPLQPMAPSSTARVSPIELSFHHLIPVLPSFAFMRPSCVCPAAKRISFSPLKSRVIPNFICARAFRA
jgi:hypothetical protein